MVLVAESRIGPGVRWFAGWMVAVLPLVVILVTGLWWADRLPDSLPSHWNREGQVDGTTSLAGLVTALAGIAVVGALVAGAGALVARIAWPARRWLVAGGAGAGAFAAALWLVTAGRSLDVTDPYQVPGPTWHILALLLGMAGGAGLAFVACGPAPPNPAATGRPAADLPRVRLPAGQRAVWSEVAYPPRSTYLVLGPLLALAAGMSLWINPWAASPVLLVAVLTFVLLTIRLTVDARGVHVGFGTWGWPRITVPLHEIESAELTTVKPSEWGGRGYRIQRARRGVIMRRGPGIALELSGGRQFVASVRDPESVAGLVNTLVDQHRR